MKIPTTNADSFVRSPPANLRVALFYGPDEGLVRERSEKLGQHIVPDLTDPFLVSELNGIGVVADPARLPDEFSAIALTGGRRLIRISQATDEITQVIKFILQDCPGDALVVLQAGQLGPRSLLRKLAESETLAAAIPCYSDDALNLEKLIHDTLAPDNIRITSQATRWLVEQLGVDRAISRNEIEKLAIYAGPNSLIDVDTAIAGTSDNYASSINELIYAVGDGNTHIIDRLLMQHFQSGTSSIAILRALTRHLMRLEAAFVRISEGHQPTKVIKSLRPPVFFKIRAPILSAN